VTTYATQARYDCKAYTTVAGAATMTVAEITQTSTTGAFHVCVHDYRAERRAATPRSPSRNDRILIKGDIDIEGTQPDGPFRACRRCR
jgi:hypothetical protein